MVPLILESVSISKSWVLLGIVSSTPFYKWTSGSDLCWVESRECVSLCLCGFLTYFFSCWVDFSIMQCRCGFSKENYKLLKIEYIVFCYGGSLYLLIISEEFLIRILKLNSKKLNSNWIIIYYSYIWDANAVFGFI